MKEDYSINPLNRYEDNRHLVVLLNDVLRRIGLRLDKMDGTQGTPTMFGNVNMQDNRITNVSNPANPRDALNVDFADDTYIRQDSTFAKTILQAPVSGQAADSGSITFTGSGSISARLASIISAGAWLGQNASVGIYPGVTVSVSGTILTFKTWMPTSASDPTPIPSTSSATVYWIAIGAIP